MAVAMAHWLDKVVERYDAMEKVKPSVITVREPFRPNHFRERNFCLKFLCPNPPPPLRVEPRRFRTDYREGVRVSPAARLVASWVA